ncbi:MAG TPA: hypothetical protein P5107_12945, partial [Thermotogota bacterium]|nr:hypothetical protein [Thermotogota bacterium]
MAVFLLFIALPVALGFLVGWLFNRKLEYRTSSKRWMVRLIALAVMLVASLIIYKITGFKIEASRMAERGFPWLSDPDFVTFSL